MIIKFTEEYYIPLEWVLNKIEAANDLELSEIIQALIQRYCEIHPDYHFYFLSLPKDPSKRREQIQNMVDFLQNHPEM